MLLTMARYHTSRSRVYSHPGNVCPAMAACTHELGNERKDASRGHGAHASGGMRRYWCRARSDNVIPGVNGLSRNIRDLRRRGWTTKDALEVFGASPGST